MATAHDPAAIVSQYGQYGAYPQHGFVQSQPMQLGPQFIQHAAGLPQGFLPQQTIAQPIVQFHAEHDDPRQKLEDKLSNLTKLMQTATGALVAKVTREIQIVKYKTKSQTVKIPVTGVTIQNGVQQMIVTQQDHTSVVPEHEEYDVKVTEPRQLADGSWAHVTMNVKKTRPAFTVEKTFEITGVPGEADPSEFGAEEGTAVSAKFLEELKKVDKVPEDLKKAESVLWGKIIKK
jgi:hypothetical protein